MRVLVACEESQAVCIAFRERGHEAYSCDLLECSGGHPEWHIKDDVLKVLYSNWDMIVAFPPCTHLAVSGARHFKSKVADGRQMEAVNLFMAIANAPCPKIAIENPVGIMSTIFCKPDQIIHPYQFGCPEQKRTCLWLKGLSPLNPTNIVVPNVVKYKSKKTKSGYTTYGAITGKNPSTNNKNNARLRSKTFPGIAKAMAEQWG